MRDLLRRCELCPRRCGVDRLNGARGFCGAGASVRIGLVSLHEWEEPCLIGDRGAGTIFFSNCTMRCVFCQNHEISCGGGGVDVDVDRLAEIFIEQQARGASNIELVTPTHYTPQIIDALTIARSRGLSLPIVWNSNGYERVETIELLRGYVDIFLPDLKYIDDESALRYSAAADYFDHASASIRAMVDQIGDMIFDGDRMKRGVLIRHLILPNRRRESMRIVDWIHENFGDAVYISLMNQYVPMHRAAEFKEIDRRLTTFEYQSVIDHAIDLGVTKCFIQRGGASSLEFVPTFDGRGVARYSDC